MQAPTGVDWAQPAGDGHQRVLAVPIPPDAALANVDDGERDGLHAANATWPQGGGELAPRVTVKKTPEQIEYLEKVFLREPYITDATRNTILATFPDMNERQVTSWFSHRRRKEKWELDVYRHRTGQSISREQLYSTPGAREAASGVPLPRGGDDRSRTLRAHYEGTSTHPAGGAAGGGGAPPPPPPPSGLALRPDPQLIAVVAYVRDHLESFGGDAFRRDGPPLGYFPPPGVPLFTVDPYASAGAGVKRSRWDPSRAQLTREEYFGERAAQKQRRIDEKQVLRMEKQARREEKKLAKLEIKQHAREERQKLRIERTAEKAKAREEKAMQREQEREEKIRQREAEKRSRLESFRMVRKLRAAELPEDADVERESALRAVRDMMVACHERGGDVNAEFPAFAPLRVRADAEREWTQACIEWNEKRVARENAMVVDGDDAPQPDVLPSPPRKPGEGDPPGLPFVLPTELPPGHELPAFPPAAVVRNLQPALPASLGPDDDGSLTADLIMVWDFTQAFREAIGIDAFTFDEFAAAVEQGSACRLLCELHIALLRHVQAEIEEAHLKKAEFGLQYNPELAAPSLLLEEAWAWGFDVDAWRAHLSSTTWPEVLRQLAIAAGFGPPRPRVAPVVDEAAAAAAASVVRHELPEHILPDSLKAAAYDVLMEAGATGMPLSELVRRVAQENKSISQSRKPEATLGSTLGRDATFVRLQPGVYAIASLVQAADGDDTGEAVRAAVAKATEGTPTAAIPYQRFAVQADEEADAGAGEGADGDAAMRESGRGESWVQCLGEAEYDALDVRQRVAALAFLVHEAMGCNAVRFSLEDRMDSLHDVRRIWRDESKLAAKKPARGRGRKRKGGDGADDAGGAGGDDEHGDDEDGGGGGGGAASTLHDLTPEQERELNMERQRLIVHLSWRMEPIGEDRRGNRYWILSTGRVPGIAGFDRLYIERQAECMDPSSLPSQWSVIADADSLRALVDCLDVAGRSEAKLKHALSLHVPELAREMEENASTAAATSPGSWVTHVQDDARAIVRFDGRPSNTDDRWFFGPGLWATSRGKGRVPKGAGDKLATWLSSAAGGSLAAMADGPHSVGAEWMEVRRSHLALRNLASVVAACDDGAFSGAFAGRAAILKSIAAQEAKGGIADLSWLRKTLFQVERAFDAAALSPLYLREPTPTIAALYGLLPDAETGEVPPLEDLVWVPQTSAAISLRLLTLDAAIAYGGKVAQRACMDSYRFIKREVSLTEDGGSAAAAAADAAGAEKASTKRGRKKAALTWPAFPKADASMNDMFALHPPEAFRREVKSAEEELGMPGAVSAQALVAAASDAGRAGGKKKGGKKKASR